MAVTEDIKIDEFMPGEITREPCLCGCGEYPLMPDAVWMRGHKARGRAGEAKAKPAATKPPPTRKTQAREAGAERGKETDRVAGLIGAFQIPATILVMVGKAQKSKPLVADGVVVSNYAPEVSKALVDLAEENDYVSRAIDYVLTAGPYGAILGALVPLTLQLAANHNVMPVLSEMGISTVDEILGIKAEGHAASNGTSA